MGTAEIFNEPAPSKGLNFSDTESVQVQGSSDSVPRNWVPFYLHEPEPCQYCKASGEWHSQVFCFAKTVFFGRPGKPMPCRKAITKNKDCPRKKDL